ncbi:flagellar hook protein FlgE [Phenylobacterium sp.]|uniref:flagellar hook protein FlgE n=1 Tax=Phenylobacterium sp. TaxID=1871053 RepID=UPI00286D4AF6|nr:flagellar hook protein FlgE [Phenylobacterium sp.]
MSINSALLAGVSGLVANSSALAAISDNIANVNTVAYKRNQVSFSNLVTSQAVTGRYSAGGVQGVTRQYVSQQGLIQSAASSTDLAIAGDGFFVVTDKGPGLTSADARSFTRAGAFGVDADGFLVNSSKKYLQGWPVQQGGGFAINPSDVNTLGSINVKNLGAAVQATGKIVISANVDQGQTISPAEALYLGTTATSMADYAKDPTTGTKPDFTIETNVIDSLGGSHKMTYAFLKSAGAPNEWHAEIYTIPNTDVSTAGRPGQVAKGLVKFAPDGSINLTTSTLFGAAGAAPTIPLAASGTATQPRWADPLGIAAQTLTFDISKVTQYATASTVNSVNSDGASVGNVVGVQVGADGVVSALFDNSQIRQIAKIAIATFPNGDGLKPGSGNVYQASIAAGQMVLKEAGNGGAGKISPSSLEASTVDLSSEFTGLISTQKAYSASSKIITTADTMLSELINIIR